MKEMYEQPVTVIEARPPYEVAAHLKHLKDQSHWDPNMPDEVTERIEEALHSGNKTQLNVTHEILDDSPYPEVRAAVPNYDEGGHTSTIRAWVIGLLFATIGSALNMLFSLRQPYIVIPSYVAQVVAYPVGVAWAKVMPNKTCRLLGIKFNLNPKPLVSDT